MDDRLALMSAIVANPAEDTPRLALADWLQEHGDEHDRARAEHIRLQVEYAPLPSSPTRRKLARRAVTLQEKHAKRWFGPLADTFSRRNWGKVDNPKLFERGLVNWPVSRIDEFLVKVDQKVMPKWFALLGINALQLYGETKRYAEIAASPALPWVSAFEWGMSELSDAGLIALAKSPHFERLSRFEVDYLRVTDRGLTAFAEKATMPNLRRVGLADADEAKYTAAGVLAVVGSDRFPKLCELDIGQPKSLKLAVLFADPRVGRLKKLSLGWESDVAAVVRSPHLTGLVELVAGEAELCDADADALLANPALKNLKSVALEADKRTLSDAARRRLQARFGTGFRFKACDRRWSNM